MLFALGHLNVSKMDCLVQYPQEAGQDLVSPDMLHMLISKDPKLI